jgi:hypothetical protein
MNGWLRRRIYSGGEETAAGAGKGCVLAGFSAATQKLLTN